MSHVIPLADHRKRTILYAEDTPATRYLVGGVLRRARYSVIEVDTGADALRLAHDMPDVIVLDVRLPDMSGIEVCRQLKANPATCKVPVLLMSATAIDTTDRVDGLDQGADGYLTHPVEPAELLATIRALIRAHVAESRARFLADVGQLLSSSIAYQQTLDAVARLAVPALADCCIVHIALPEPGTSVEPIAVAVADPMMESRVRELGALFPDDPGAPFAAPSVMSSGKAALIEDVPGELERNSRGSADARHIALLRELGVTSVMVAPLTAQAAIVGTITFVAAGHDRTFTRDDLALAEDIARRAATAIQTARLFADIEHARKMLEEQTSELQEQQEELEVSNEELRATVEELDQARNDAEAARTDADAANKAKSEFLAMMSHELRTPLTAIAGYVDLLTEQIKGPINDAQRQYLVRMKKAQSHLLTLINDVLSFAKLESGQVRVELEPVPVAELCSRLESMIQPQVEAKGISYNCAPVAHDEVVIGDRERLLQVLLNLAGNALKFTPEGGRIDVHTKVDGDEICISVTDSGRGIAADQLKAIFEPFVQVGRQLTGASPGVGLGLAISRDLARAMGGDLTAESEPGKGSSFHLTLRRAPVAAVAAAASA